VSRTRGIGPDFWRDEDMMELPHWMRLFYVGTWVEAQCFGGFQDNPKGLWRALLAGDTIPDGGSYRPATWTDARAALDTLIEREKLVPYSSDGKHYLWIRSWFRRNPSIDYPSPPTIPLPPWIVWHGEDEYPTKERNGGLAKNRRRWHYELLEEEVPPRREGEAA
jgi:hypothetical protein